MSNEMDEQDPIVSRKSHPPHQTMKKFHQSLERGCGLVPVPR